MTPKMGGFLQERFIVILETAFYLYIPLNRIGALHDIDRLIEQEKKEGRPIKQAFLL